MGKLVKRLSLVVFGALIVAGLIFSANTNVVQAAEINLTYGGNWPPNHPMSVATQEWINKIAKETNGRVNIKPFWASALYKPRESAMELGKGVADIGDLSGAYAPVGYAFEKSMRMAFWGVDDRILARKVYYAAREKYPQLDKEFTDGNVKVMAYASIPPYQLLVAKKKIASTADFKGMTIKATGDIAKLINELGGSGINMPMGETYTALQKTTIDGAVAPYETLKSFRFAEVVKYALELNIGAAPAGHWAFNLDSWKKLPKDIQKVIEDNIEWFSNRIEELVYAGEELGINLAKEHKVEFLKLPASELDKVYAIVEKTILQEMKAVDDQGLPGTEVYQYMRSLIKQHSK
ncbi:MAG: TRAP transporter substrate-binding protein DctP [Deltaproteobacteria bacterium]|nr:TRAP transporter substrate-binding protein DctP [Deltaproteobacteria bacterium]